MSGGRPFLRGMIAGALITLGMGAGIGLVAMMARDYLRQEAQASAPLPEPRIAPVTGEPGDLLSELTAASRAEEARGAPPPTSVPVAASEAVATPELLAGQSETKRNQMLVVDLYLQVLGRYPNTKEQKAWFDAEAPLHKQLRSLRLVGEEDVGVANFIAGTLMDGPAYRQRFPAPEEALRAAAKEGDNAAAVGALLARAVGSFPEARGDGAALVRALQARFRLSPGQVTSARAMTELLRAVSDSTDVGEHWLEIGAPLGVELDAIRTQLRSGRVVVVRGHEPTAGPGRPAEPRWALVTGFDAKGAFLVRDPRGELPERTEPEQLMAFLRGAPGPADAGVAVPGGVWLDVNARLRQGRCPPLAVASLPGKGPLASDQRLPGFTGVIEGAQVNLTRLRIPPGEHTMRGTMSVTAEEIDQILAAAKSPAAGNGAAFVRFGQYYNLDPLYAVAFFRRESWFGTHPRWVGQMGGGRTTKNIGNIRYFGPPDPERQPQYTGFNGFRAYRTWEDGIQDWFRLLAFDSNYAGLHTVERVLPIYAPSFENDTDNYVRDVIRFVAEWRAQFRGPPRPAPVLLADDGCR